MGEWKLVIPVGVLRDHFEGVLKDLFSETGTEDEWSLIGLDRDKASSYTEADIKRATRLALAKAHPDVNKDPDAHERFLKVQDAGDVLATPRGRHFSIDGRPAGGRRPAEAAAGDHRPEPPPVQLRPAPAQRVDHGRGRRPPRRAGRCWSPRSWTS